MPSLTFRKAKALVVQEFGTAKGLEAAPNAPNGYYQMQLGNLTIELHNTEPQIGCIILTVIMAGRCGYFEKYYDPYTLEENGAIEEEMERKQKQAALEAWVGELGPEICHAMIDRAWEG